MVAVESKFVPLSKISVEFCKIVTGRLLKEWFKIVGASYERTVVAVENSSATVTTTLCDALEPAGKRQARDVTENHKDL